MRTADPASQYDNRLNGVVGVRAGARQLLRGLRRRQRRRIGRRRREGCDLEIRVGEEISARLLYPAPGAEIFNHQVRFAVGQPPRRTASEERTPFRWELCTATEEMQEGARLAAVGAGRDSEASTGCGPPVREE